MFFIKLNRTIPTPLYQQIIDEIIYATDAGLLIHGDFLPTEKEFMQIYNVSSNVVKQAYRSLESTGHIVRIKGKGTFVNKRRVFSADYAFLASFVDPKIVFKGEYIIKINVDRLSYDIESYSSLDLTEGEKCDMIINLIVENEMPICYQATFFPIKYFKNVEEYIETDIDIETFLRNNYPNQKITRELNLTSIIVDDLYSRILNLDIGDPILICKATYSVDGQKIAYIRNAYPGKHTIVEGVI